MHPGPFYFLYILSHPLSRVEMESRRRDAAEDDEDWSERAIEKEEEVERGGRGRAEETAEPR